VIAVICAIVVALLDAGWRSSPGGPDRGADGGGGGGGGWGGHGGGGGGGWGGGPRSGSRPGPPDSGLPLPDAQPARVRFRGHRRLADVVPDRPRRGCRQPARTPSRLG
jgi:hypothetical protein